MNVNLDLMLSPNDKDVIRLDVSNMAAPDPMQAILLALSELPQQKILNVSHRKEPFPLYSILKKQGFEYVTQSTKEGFLISIWRCTVTDINALNKARS